MLELLVRLEYKRRALARTVLGMAGVSSDSYFLVTWFLFTAFYFWAMPLLYVTLYGGSVVVIGETALVVVMASAGIYMIITVVMAPIGVLLL